MSVFDVVRKQLSLDNDHLQGTLFWFSQWLKAKAEGDSTPDTYADPFREFKHRCGGLLDHPTFREVYQTHVGERAD
jgi:hypothetical protein